MGDVYFLKKQRDLWRCGRASLIFWKNSMHTDIKAFRAMFIHIYKINIVLSCSLAHNRYFQYPDRGERKGGKKNTIKNKMADKDRGHKITFSYFPRILIRLYLLLPCAFSWEYNIIGWLCFYKWFCVHYYVYIYICSYDLSNRTLSYISYEKIP